MKTKAYAYLRVSGLGQVNGDGFQRQQDEIKAFASNAGIEIVEWFEEQGISGTADREDRPAFTEMVSKILANGVRTIVVERLDRLAREFRVQESLLIYLASKGVTLINASTGEDVTAAIAGDPMRLAMVQIQGVFAQLEKGMLVKKLRAAKDRIRARDGRCEGRKEFETTVQGKAVLSEIKRLRRKKKGTKRSMSNAEIAETLNAKGFKSSLGKPFTARIVFDVAKAVGTRKES